MHRLLAVGVATTALLTLGCATQTAPTATNFGFESATASVDAGPPACEAIHARIHRSESSYGAQTGTWLDAPHRMVEGRRLRALHARAEQLGCALPRI